MYQVSGFEWARALRGRAYCSARILPQGFDYRYVCGYRTP